MGLEQAHVLHLEAHTPEEFRRPGQYMEASSLKSRHLLSKANGSSDAGEPSHRIKERVVERRVGLRQSFA
jgi:hypothetical protein